MVEIPLLADVYFPKGETPLLLFRDVMEAEKFVKYLQKQIERISCKRGRLEYFSDGVYFDGKYLDLSPKLLAILRAFEFTDKLMKMDLIERVWGNPYVNKITVSSTISHFNSLMKDKDIFISYSDGYYSIYRP